ncbi:hypothetical protein ACJW31_10G109600 [Castanea mollissima]
MVPYQMTLKNFKVYLVGTNERGKTWWSLTVLSLAHQNLITLNQSETRKKCLEIFWTKLTRPTFNIFKLFGHFILCFFCLFIDRILLLFIPFFFFFFFFICAEQLMLDLFFNFCFFFTAYLRFFFFFCAYLSSIFFCFLLLLLILSSLKQLVGFFFFFLNF